MVRSRNLINLLGDVGVINLSILRRAFFSSCLHLVAIVLQDRQLEVALIPGLLFCRYASFALLTRDIWATVSFFDLDRIYQLASPRSVSDWAGTISSTTGTAQCHLNCAVLAVETHWVV